MRFAHDLSGEGARYVGGRWNSIGRRAIYLVPNKPSAILQIMRHVGDLTTLLPTMFNYAAIPVSVPSRASRKVVKIDELPHPWSVLTDTKKTAKIGDDWLDGNKSLLLIAPDALIYGESIIVMNPAHPEIRNVRLGSPEPLFNGDSTTLKEYRTANWEATRIEKRNQKDVFICHASEDKLDVVEPLTEALKKAGITYWVDNNEIKWGDSVPERINSGLKTSNFVILVLSKSFMKKTWPQREMNSALNYEASNGKKKVLPLMIGNENDIKNIHDELFLQNDKKYLKWDQGLDSIVKALSEVLDEL